MAAPQMQLPLPTILWAIALTAVVTPYWVTSLPSAVDLPQHLAQMWLFSEAIDGTRPDIVVTPWYYPNTLVYWVLFPIWKLLSPVATGRTIMCLLATGWIGATYLVQQIRNRPIENWFCASPIVFCFLFNWGLLNFLVGWPIFCIFVAIVSAPRFRGQLAAISFSALLLYFAHALWFLMANAWLLALCLDDRSYRRLHFAYALVPTWILAATWYPKLAAARHGSGVPTGLVWGSMPVERLDFERFVDGTFGSITGPAEEIVSAWILLWVLCTVVLRWRQLDKETDRPLLLASLVMLLGYWALPEVYMNSIFFSQRWLPLGVTLLLLALPALPKVGRSILIGIGALSLCMLSYSTIQAWKTWEEEQLGGLLESLSCIQSQDRVLAINLDYGSLSIKGRPGLQLFAYAQALRHADIFFSFSEHFSGPVQYRIQPPPNPERNLVWEPGSAKIENTFGYTAVLINGGIEMQEHYVKKLKLARAPCPSDKTWRLYQPSTQPTAPPSSRHP